MKTTLKVFLFFMMLLCIFNTAAHAQTNTQDVVYLKNGSIIHGTILEIIPNQTIKIETSDRNVFVFKMEEVEKITKPSPDLYKKTKKKSVNYFEVGYLTGIGDATLDGSSAKNEYHAVSLRFATGSQVNEEFSYGIGIGYGNYSGNDNYLPSTEYIPVFLDMRILFSSTGDALPGLNFAFGYDIGLTTKNYNINTGYSYFAYKLKFSGGIFLNPSLNLTCKLNPNISLLLNFGYEFQSHKISADSGTNGNSATLESGFLTFRTGIAF